MNGRSTESQRSDSQLADAIRGEIERRLPGRIRDLRIRLDKTSVVLEGHCATYHTKQLAQHAAFAIIAEEASQDGQVENEIVVTQRK